MDAKADPLAQLNDISIRRVLDDEQDYLLMSRWLTDERVLEWYEGRDNPHDLAKVREKYGLRARGEDRVVPCLILRQGSPIGYIQYLALNEEEGTITGLDDSEGAYGIDMFIGEVSLWSQGIGTTALTALVRYLFEVLGALRLTIDPIVTNHRAIRCYEKSGFKKVKVLPNHEPHEGQRRDSWLMILEAERT